MARVRFHNARVVPGIGLTTTGAVYDVPEDMAASLVEQGAVERIIEATRAPNPAPTPIISKRSGPAGKAGDERGE